jgi:uncharacterized protein YpbB
VTHLALDDLRRTDMEERLEKIEKEDLLTRWQFHRRWCLRLATRLGAATPEQAVEIADKISDYVLHGALTKKT